MVLIQKLSRVVQHVNTSAVRGCHEGVAVGFVAQPVVQNTRKLTQRPETRPLADAGLAPESIDYINAHGTSTPLGDAAEVAAVKELFQDHAMKLAMSSTKSMTGHTLGAAGGLESVAVVKSIKHGILPPTINLDNPDEGFDLDFVPNEARASDVRIALNNSFGFGGHNVSLAFGRFEG